MADAAALLIRFDDVTGGNSPPATARCGDHLLQLIPFHICHHVESGSPRALLEELPSAGVRLVVNERHDHGVCLKLAFRYALERNLQAVIVAGNGTCTPPRPLLDAMPDILSGAAGALYLGASTSAFSRFLAPGGQPRLDWSWCAYSVAALRELPFMLNGRDSIFDAELAIQFTLSDYPVRWLEGDPGSGHRPSHHGLRHLRRQAMALMRYRFHSLGILYQLNFDVRRHQTDYTPKFGYASSHEYALDCIPQGASVLDLGAGEDAYMAGPLREKGCRVFAADMRPIDNPLVEEAYQLDLNSDPLPPSVGNVDVVLLLDVIEHLVDPERLLIDLRNQASYERTRVIVTTPNIAFIVTRLMLLIGQFNYGKSGILDRTHTRLFTYRSLRRTLRQCGYVIEEVRGVPAPFPKALGETPLANFLLRFNQLLIGLSKSLFAYQLFVTLRLDPTYDTVRRGHER